MKDLFRIYIKSVIIVLVFLLDLNVAQNVQRFPTNGNNNDFTSAFGPRMKSTGYNFHEGIDITTHHAAGDIYAIDEGDVVFAGIPVRNGVEKVDEECVVILHGGYYLVRYTHLSHSVNVGDRISETNLLIGSTKEVYINQGRNNYHLDIRHYPNNSLLEEATNPNTRHPYRLLTTGGNFDTKPVLLDENGDEITKSISGYYEHNFVLKEDNNNNKYFRFGIRTSGTELDLNRIKIELTGTNSYGTPYSTGELLYDPDHFAPGLGNIIDYQEKINCGTDQPDTYNKVFIEAQSWQSGSHYVYFKWYIDEVAFIDLVNRVARLQITLKDAKDCNELTEGTVYDISNSRFYVELPTNLGGSQKELAFYSEQMVGPVNFETKMINLSKGINEFKWVVKPKNGGSYHFVVGTENSVSPTIKFESADEYEVELWEKSPNSQNRVLASKLWGINASIQASGDIMESVSRTFKVVPALTPYMVVKPAFLELSKDRNENKTISVSIFNQTTQAFNITSSFEPGMLSSDLQKNENAISVSVNENFGEARWGTILVDAEVEFANATTFVGKVQSIDIKQAEVGPVITPIVDNIYYNTTSANIAIQNTGTGTLRWYATIDPGSVGWIRGITIKNSSGETSDLITGDGSIDLVLDQNNNIEPRYGRINIFSENTPYTIEFKQAGNPYITASSIDAQYAEISASVAKSYYYYGSPYTSPCYTENALRLNQGDYTEVGYVVFNASDFNAIPQGSVITTIEMLINFSGSGEFEVRDAGQSLTCFSCVDNYKFNNMTILKKYSSSYTNSYLISDVASFVSKLQAIISGSSAENIYLVLTGYRLYTSNKPILKIYFKNNLQVNQVKSSNTSFGAIEYSKSGVSEITTVPFGKLIQNIGESFLLKASSDYAPGTTELFHHWEKSNSTIKSILNKSEFTITSGINTFTAVFQPTTRNIVIRNIFDGATTLSSAQNIVQFKDPWLIDATTNNNKGSGADYLPLQSPFNMSNNPTYKGIFLNQELPSANNYSIRFPSTVQYSTINCTSDFLFQSIEGAGVSNLTSPSLSNGLFQSDVVFNNNTATITAFYKGAHFTSSPGALSNTSQRKVVKTPDGTIHMVYESMGKVWYESRGANETDPWVLGNEGNPLSTNDSKSPSIDNFQGDIVIVFQENDNGEADIRLIKMRNGAVVSNKVVFETQDNHSTNLEPTIASSECQGDLMVVAKILNPRTVNGISSNPGLYYKSFRNYYDGIATENGTYIPLTTSSSNCTSISVDKEDSFYEPTFIIGFHLTCETDGNIIYYHIPTSGQDIKKKQLSLSNSCVAPIVGCIEHNSGTPGKAYPIVGWVSNGKVNIKYGLESTTDWTNDAENYSSWSNTYEFGSNVNSVDLIGYANANKTALITWTESSGTIKYVTFNAGVFSSTRKLNGLTGSVHLMQGATATDEALAYYVDAATPPYEIKNTQLVSALPTFSLQSGWNWFSLNCTPPNFAINSLFNQSTFTEDDIIKGQTSYAQFLTGGGWVGSLSGLNANEMYKIKLSNAINLTVDGDYVDLAVNQIPLRTGYNWIAYSPSSANSISNALAPAFLPVTGDKIKSKSLIAEYNGTNWIGSLSLLNPGEGYLYHSLSDKVLQWNNSASSKIVNVPETVRINKIAVPGWEVNPNKFENNMSVIAELKNVSSFTGDDVLAAFIGNDCRGSATPIMYNDKQLYFLVIHGDNSEIENVRLKFFSGKMKKKVNVIEEFNYAVNKDLGSLVNPVKLTLSERSLEIPTEFNLSQNYPNPFNPSTTIEFGLPESKMVRVEVFNSIGQRVKTLLANTLNAGYHSVTWDGTDDFGSTVSSGLYLYRINAGNFSRTRKMMFLK